MKSLYRVAVPALIVASTLAACSSDDSTATGECRDFSSGSISDSIEVDGEFGEVNPTVTFDAPLEPNDLERTIVNEGDGEETEPGQLISLVVTVVNGTSGENSVSQPVSFPVAGADLVETFAAGIECVPIGSRVVTVQEASVAFGDEGNANIGIAADDAIVVVTDVVEINEPVPTADWTEGVPEVELAEDGTPTVTIPDADAPTELLLTVLEEGDGEEVVDGDDVTVNYQGTIWETGEVFDQSYGGEPALLNTRSVVEGFRSALVGQRVGSTVLVSMPPEYAYGEEAGTTGLEGQTLVFVVEIVSSEEPVPVTEAQ